jgi:hypothetical protein
VSKVESACGTDCDRCCIAVVGGRGSGVGGDAVVGGVGGVDGSRAGTRDTSVSQDDHSSGLAPDIIDTSLRIGGGELVCLDGTVEYACRLCRSPVRAVWSAYPCGRYVVTRFAHPAVHHIEEVAIQTIGDCTLCRD